MAQRYLRLGGSPSRIRTIMKVSIIHVKVEALCLGSSGCKLVIHICPGRLVGRTHLDRIGPNWVPGIFGALKVKAVRGSCASMPLGLASWCFALKGPATTPNPVSTRACPREPALDPNRGISLRAWKLRGLRPRTTIGAVVDSVRTVLVPLANVATTFRCSTKCCWSSFRRPLFAVALQPCQQTEHV
jgi:hypothetical protein